jgi:hypothetical protein
MHALLCLQNFAFVVVFIRMILMNVKKKEKEKICASEFACNT